MSDNEEKKKEFQAFDHGTGKIDLSQHQHLIQMKPVEIHHKEDGTKDDKPSFAIVMTSPVMDPVVGQISLEMLNEGLEDIGYKIEKQSKNID